MTEYLYTLGQTQAGRFALLVGAVVLAAVLTPLAVKLDGWLTRRGL